MIFTSNKFGMAAAPDTIGTRPAAIVSIVEIPNALYPWMKVGLGKPY